ncbi:MAG: cation-transporting P-type ATPase, partial [Myxococcales bacterium]|nr:cation-transporting P-type ATPase [Myxococcales bacterium]
MRAMVAAARASALKVVAATDTPESVAWCAPDTLLEPGPDIVVAIRALQRHGHGVAVVATGADPALAAADLGLALHTPGAPPPWQAHIIGGTSVDDVLLVLEAMRAARKASSQSTTLAMIEALAGLTLSLDHDRRGGVQRVLGASGMVGLLAIANGARLARDIVPPHPDPGLERTPWHALEPTEVLERLGTRVEGLQPAQVAARRPSVVAEPGPVSDLASAVMTELATPFAPILATGAGLSALLGSTLDASMVAATVLASGVVGGVQRVRADRATRALAQRRQETLRVQRDGRVVHVAPEDVVRGDIVHLEAGERVPADLRILSCRALEVDES